MDLFNLSAKLTLDSSDYMAGIDKSESRGASFAKTISAKTIAAGQMLGNLASKAISTVGSMTKELVKGSIDAYANYEQLTGGIETLFGTGGRTMEEYLAEIGDHSEKAIAEYKKLEGAQQTVMKNAQNAYKTAGLSANEYMETATSFAASLVSSLRGDTEQAAYFADMAVQDMADNANKMGTDMSAIQSAYQGFAKQNYTMLDNLKLGYGGTKTEMERLLADAMKISGKKYNLESLADVYEAIHVIQTELGITGTTAKEAEGTISGSFNMMKASWENFKTALGDPDADLSARIDELMQSAKTYIGNWVPVFKRVIVNLWESLKTAAANLGGLIFGKNEDGEVNWPTWQDVKGAALSVWEYIKQKAGDLAGLVFGRKEDGTVDWPTWDDVKAKAQEVWGTIKENARTLAGLVFGTKEDGSVDWPTWDDVKAGAEALWTTIKTNIKSFAGMVFGKKADGKVDWPTWDDVKTAAETAWNTIKTEAAKLKGLIFGDAADAGDIFAQIQEKWTNLKTTIEDGAIQIATYFFGDADPETVKSALEGVATALKAIGAAVVMYFTVKKVQGMIDMFNGIKDALTAGIGQNKVGLILATIAAAIELIIDNWDKIEPVLQEVGGWLQEVGGWLQENLINPINEFIDSIKEAIKQIGNFFGLDTSGWFKKETELPQYDEPTGPVEYSTAHLDDAQIQSLIAARQIAKDNPDAMFMGTDGVTRNAMDGFVKTFEDTLRAGGFNDDQIQQFTNGLKTLSDSGFAELMTTLRNAEGYYDESGQKVEGLGSNSSTAADSVSSLGAAAQNAASELNSVQAPTYGGGSHAFGHAKGLWSVPYDGYMAQLHRGERVLTASQARRQGQDGNVDLRSLGDIVREAIGQGMNGATVNSYLSGKDITDDTNRRTARQLKARRFAT